jgi:hypothetical protein
LQEFKVPPSDLILFNCVGLVSRSFKRSGHGYWRRKWTMSSDVDASNEIIEPKTSTRHSAVPQTAISGMVVWIAAHGTAKSDAWMFLCLQFLCLDLRRSPSSTSFSYIHSLPVLSSYSQGHHNRRQQGTWTTLFVKRGRFALNGTTTISKHQVFLCLEDCSYLHHLHSRYNSRLCKCLCLKTMNHSRAIDCLHSTMYSYEKELLLERFTLHLLHGLENFKPATISFCNLLGLIDLLRPLYL